MKKNTKVIFASLSILASTATLMPMASTVMADTTPVVATTNSTSTQDNIKTISMAITKTGTTTPSEAAMFLGNEAKVAMKDGKISEICIHVDGSKTPMTKGQDMTKMIPSLSLNGVAGKQANAAKDGSSFDFVFPVSAYKEGKGSLECQLNVMGKTMDEKADVVLGKVAETTTDATKTETDKNAASTAKTEETKKTTKKAVKKAKVIKRTLKHNAYVYKKNGKRANKKVLKKGHKVSTYGKAIKLHGKAFFRISKNTYVKKANF